MKKYSKSKKKRLIILAIIVILILAILVIVMSNRREDPVAHANPLIAETDTKNDGILNLSGFGTFFDYYTGDLMASEIATGLKEITINKIPRIYKAIKDYNKSELETFYNNNSNSIKNMVGIDNQEDFIKFALGLQEANVEFGKWDRLDIVTDSFKDESDKPGYAYSEYEVTYRNDNIIRFTGYIAKSSTTDVRYIINVAE